MDRPFNQISIIILCMYLYFVLHKKIILISKKNISPIHNFVNTRIKQLTVLTEPPPEAGQSRGALRKHNITPLQFKLSGHPHYPYNHVSYIFTCSKFLKRSFECKLNTVTSNLPNSRVVKVNVNIIHLRTLEVIH